ncbi:metallophosphatase domain-containing protein [Zunongwangia sp.]|uniref:metallophosphatase domain-containing protein n=1 Tax=Zunongwangia sp. TaxID=1965325 RepID=UPI003AA9BE26
MRLVILSDTHGKHHELQLPEGDILIHCGDITEGGSKREIIDFLNWFSSLPHTHKIFIGGNHDFELEKLPNKKIQDLIPENITYLQDSGITIKSYRFWGSAYTPGEANWAFHKDRGKQIKKTWDKIPNSTDVLITHTPPYSILDEINNNIHIGCEELLKNVINIKPKIHCFGHSHNEYGQVKLGDTNYINSAILDNRMRVMNPVFSIEI